MSKSQRLPHIMAAKQLAQVRYEEITVRHCHPVYTVFQKNRWHRDFFLHNSVKNEMVLVTFGTQNPEETSQEKIINVSTSPVKCSHCTLWNADNVHLIKRICIITRWQYYHLRQMQHTFHYKKRCSLHRPKSCHPTSAARVQASFSKFSLDYVQNVRL